MARTALDSLGGRRHAGLIAQGGTLASYAIVDAGACAQAPTTVLDLVPMASGDEPVVVREGRGSLQALGL